MLTKPRSGWTVVYIGEKSLGSASYLDDVPVYLLDAFIQYLSDDNSLNFCVNFDKEGSNFGIFEFNESLYYADNETDILDTLNVSELNPGLLGLPSYSRAKKMLYILAKELIHDIEDNLNDWIYWIDSPKEMAPDEKCNRKKLLLKKLKSLKRLIEKHEK